MNLCQLDDECMEFVETGNIRVQFGGKKPLCGLISCTLGHPTVTLHHALRIGIDNEMRLVASVKKNRISRFRPNSVDRQKFTAKLI